MRDDNKNSVSSNSDVPKMESRLNLLYEIGRILASAETTSVAAPQILESICRNLQFEIGELWRLDKDETVLRLESVWHLPDSELEKFAALSHDFEFVVGDGLPGKVWANKAPVWIEDLDAGDFPRRFIIAATGLQSGFAFPVLLGDKLLGVVSCFSGEKYSTDETLLQMVAAVGNNIGQFIKRERAESSLRVSEENFRAFMQASSQAIWTTDVEGRNLEAFGWWENQTGQTREQSAGAGFLEAVHPDDRRRVAETWQDVMTRPSFFEAEFRISDRSGEYHHFALRGVPVFNTDDSFRQWIGTLNDITDRKLAEQSLKDNEERYRALVEATSTVVWRANENGELNFVGSQWEKVSGQQVQDVLGSGWTASLHPDDRENTIKIWQNALAAKSLYETEFRILMVNGEYRWFAVRGVPILKPDGSLREWVGANSDITDRKQAESRLSLLSEISEMTRTFDNADDLLFAVSKAIGEHLQARRCLFNEINLENDLETVHRDYRRGAKSVAGTHRISEYSSTTSAEMRSGKTVVNNDSKIDARTAGDYERTYQPTGERAYIAVPLLRENVWVASLWLSDDEPRHWSEQEIALLETVAERTWTAIEKLRINVALRQSEERYRSLFETMDEGFCLCEMIFDADGKSFDYRFLEVNPVFEKMTGLKDAIGKTAREIIKNFSSNRFEIYGKVVLTGESVRFTDALEGTDIWFEIYASRVGGDDSRKFTLLFNDISERKLAEIALRESQAHLALALKVGRAGTFEWDIKNNINTWSPEIEAMYGVPVGTFEGTFEGWKTRVVPEDARRVEREIRNALETKAKDFEYEFRVILPDISQRWFAGRARFEYDDDRRPLRMIGINVDVTERKLTEIELSDARVRLESTLTAGEIGTWMWYIADNTVVADKNLARMFSVSEEDANGGKIENYIRAIHPEDRERVAAIIAQAIETGEDYEADYRLVSPKGNICWVIARGTVEYDREGSAVSLPGVVLDITGRKEAEFERELLFIEARKAREIAERANRSKDEFIALVSHELRSPLNAMLGWTRILQKKQADEKTTEYALDVIVKNARSQSRLIEDLLDIARIGEGKLRLEMYATEILPIINAAVETIKPAADAKNIRIVKTFDPTADFISGDDDRLRQIVENLLSNAVKFTPEGGKIEIILKRDGNQAQIIVSDTGQGITADFLPQIFERFKQADPSTTRRHGGLGIGLSLARDLVELHGGTISAQSEGEGTGATFIFTLPLRSVKPIKQNSGSEGNMSSQGKLYGFWILAVDDEADAREIVSFMLQINGAKVTTANSAVEALEILNDCNGRLPDILLSDISMPFESGYALVQKVRALPFEKGGQIPAVALTAFNRPEDREAAFEAGFQKHLGKPVDMDALIAAIVETAGVKQS